MNNEQIKDRTSAERLDLAASAARVAEICTTAGERTYELGRAMRDLDAAWQRFRKAARRGVEGSETLETAAQSDIG